MYFIKIIGKVLVIIFAIIGLVFAGVFVAMKLGWTNVRGTIKERNSAYFQDISNSQTVSGDENKEIILSCKIHALFNYAPDTANKIDTEYRMIGNVAFIEKMLEYALIRYRDTALVSDFNNCNGATILDKTPLAQTAYAWADSDEWGVLKFVFTRDQDIIKKAAKDAGISPRILLGGVIGEQLRFFSNRRESFKAYFEPLKILATLSSFSYGIAGLKPDTVAKIDDNLKNKNSVFYLGSSMENVITYPEGENIEKLRFERITDTKNTYYSYLYVGLFMRQVTAQWLASGYDIRNRVGILSTLYNLGFNRSIPKPDASLGGSSITINDQEYSFGELGEEFYYSGELLREFPL
ncbi:MAG: hypothetical protein WCW93_01350 [Candidatus Paceibacterota bacterium]